MVIGFSVGSTGSGWWLFGEEETITKPYKKTCLPVVKTGLEVDNLSLGSLWWVVRDLNPRPPECKSGALAN